MKIQASIIFPFVLFFSVIATQAETIHLSIAASMTDASKELIADFTKTHNGTKIQPNFASSGSLAKQITQGAPADIFVSANPKWMAYLINEKLIAPGTDRIFVFNTLVFISANQQTNLTLKGLVSLNRIAIGSPNSVPAGKYAKQALENTNIYKKLTDDRKLIMAKDVRQALLYADRGEVDGAFVYKTDALIARNAKVIFTVPGELYDRVSYPIGITVAGAKNMMVKTFYDYMTSPEAITILTKYGFEPNLQLAP